MARDLIELRTDSRSFAIDKNDLATMVAHGMAVKIGETTYRLALRTELRADPGSVGVNNADPSAVIAVVKAALAATQVPAVNHNPDRDSRRILEQFAQMYRSGSQGAEMDYEAAQALALAIDDVLSPTLALTE